MNGEKFTAGWSFRTSTPAFDPGEEFALYVTGRDDGTPVGRVGDTLLTVHDAPADVTDGTKIEVRVTDFDESTHTGEAAYLRTIAASTR